MNSVDNELQGLGLKFLKEHYGIKTYIRLINDVIQIVNIEKISNNRRIRVLFDIVPVYTDNYYWSRSWTYQLKKMRHNLSVMQQEYIIFDNPDYEAEIIEDINKYLKPIFNEFDKTEKLLNMLILLDNRNYRIEAYSDFRKLAISLYSQDYEYAMFILLHLKYDHVVWDYRTDLNIIREFEEIDLKKYTEFSYVPDKFINKIDELIFYIKNNKTDKINEYLQQNKKDMLARLENSIV